MILNRSSLACSITLRKTSSLGYTIIDTFKEGCVSFVFSHDDDDTDEVNSVVWTEGSESASIC